MDDTRGGHGNRTTRMRRRRGLTRLGLGGAPDQPGGPVDDRRDRRRCVLDHEPQPGRPVGDADAALRAVRKHLARLGTCGNDWAEDTFDRDFTVRTSAGSTTVVEQFKHGSFVTNTGASPGACDTTDGYGPGTVAAGHTGSMHGYFVVSGSLTPTSTSSFCDALLMTNADCTTATFINTHFVSCYPATRTVTTFFDHYSAGDQGSPSTSGRTPRATAAATTATSPTSSCRRARRRPASTDPG